MPGTDAREPGPAGRATEGFSKTGVCWEKIRVQPDHRKKEFHENSVCRHDNTWESSRMLNSWKTASERWGGG